MGNCKFISEADKQDVARGAIRSFRVGTDAPQLDDGICDQDYEYEYEDAEWLEKMTESTIYNVATTSSPVIDTFYAHHPVWVLCDSGAESSLIKYSVAVKMSLQIHPTKHWANQADGIKQMTACGEVLITLTRDDISLPIEAIVMKELGCDIIGGAPFMESNDIILDMPKQQIVIAGKHHYS